MPTNNTSLCAYCQYYGCRDNVCTVVKNIGEVKGKIIPSALRFIKPYLLQNLKYVGAMVTEFHFFNRIKEEHEVNTQQAAIAT